MNEHILEKLQIASGFLPVNMQTGANAGDWVSLKDYYRCAVVFFKGAGTAGDDPILTLMQATDVSGTGAKALNFTRVDIKQGTLTAVGQFTTVTQAAGDTYTNDTLAEAEAIVVIDIKADDLDVNNGFDCIQASVGDVGTHTQNGCVLYIGHDPRYSVSPLPSAIAN